MLKGFKRFFYLFIVPVITASQTRYWHNRIIEKTFFNDARTAILQNNYQTSIQELKYQVFEREKQHSGLLFTEQQTLKIAIEEFNRAKENGYVNCFNELCLERIV